MSKSNSFINKIRFSFSDVTEVPDILKQSHYPSLDGFRGISIILVVLFHLNNGQTYYLLNGGLGVDIFFVISGFLITTLLFKEKIKTKTISLKRFYIRRFLRIFPVAYLYLFIIIILNYVLKLNISVVNFCAAFLYIMNFSYFLKYYNSRFTQHYWSLSVEEQFYLIFPFLLKRYYKIYLGFILFIIFILPLILILPEISQTFNNSFLYAGTHYLIKFQGIAVGCLLSVLVFKNIIKLQALQKFKIAINLIVIAILCFLKYDENYSIETVFINLFVSFLVGYLILSNLIQSKDLIFRFLNLKALTTVGILSYSIYIWQQLFTSFDNRLPSFMTNLPFNVICLLVIAYCSYNFYEKRFLKLKDKFESKSKGIKTSAKQITEA